MQMLSVCLLLVGLTAAAIPFEPTSEEEARLYRLPDTFLIGAGTSAFQTEGAATTDGKTESTMDVAFNHRGDPSLSGEVGPDCYHHIDDDVEMIKRLKLQVYRFSLSWARLLPEGNATKPNEAGVRYYNELINKLQRINVQPLVTLFHFDLPVVISDKTNGGWSNDAIIDEFVSFADFAFKTFGDRVKYWTTINEPNAYCLMTSQGFLGATRPAEADDAFYSCIRRTLLAHAKSYRNYQKYYAPTQQGMVGFSYHTPINRPNSTSYEDIQAAERANIISIDIVAHPVVYGDYPELIKTVVDAKGASQGRPSSLQRFTEDEIRTLRGSADFLAINVYYGITVADRGESTTLPIGTTSSVFTAIKFDFGVVEVDAPSAVAGGSPFGGNIFQTPLPWAMHESLVYTWDKFKLPVFITENGFEDSAAEGIHDQNRAAYHSVYMRTIAETINKNKVDCFGITVWCLVDGLEWSKGNNSKFGLVHVDYSTPDRTRTLKDSSAFFIKMAEDRVVPLVLPKANNNHEQTTQRTEQTTRSTQQTTRAPAMQTTQQTLQPADSGSATPSLFWGTCFLITSATLIGLRS